MLKRHLSVLGGILIMCLLFTIPGLAQDRVSLPLKDASEIADRFYQNPLKLRGIGDPFILPADNKYYAFATGGSSGFSVWISEDMKTFDNKQIAFEKANWASGDYWAPEVYAYQGKYVMLFSARRQSDDSLRIGIAFSDGPQGPYVDPLDAPLFDPGYAVIDADLLVDEDGTPYLYYSRDCSENVVGVYHESHIYGVPLSPDLLSLAGEPVMLTVPDQVWETKSGDYRWNEGPAVFKQNGNYYLFYSSNYFASKEYGVGVAVSKSPLGPFDKAATNPLLSYAEKDGKVVISGPGHNSFFAIGKELFTAYHTHTYPIKPSGNRQLNYSRAGFHADGTAYINGPTKYSQLLPYALLKVDNLAPLAAVTWEGSKGDGLTDGDYCISPASASYAFTGTAASLTWEKGITADTVILYPGTISKAAGKMIIDDTYETPIDFSACEDAPGSYLIFPFDPMTVHTIKLELDAETALGEIIVLGNQ